MYENPDTFEITHLTIDGRIIPAMGQMSFIQDHGLYNAPGGIRLSAGNALIASFDLRIPTIIDGEVINRGIDARGGVCDDKR
jgi:hypothetical protein